MRRDELLSRLERLLPAQLEEVLFHLRIPSTQLSGVSAPQSMRAIEVVRHLENAGELARLEPLLLSYDGAARMSKISAPPSTTAKPVPIYPDAEVEALSKRLENARARKKRLRDSGIKADDLDREILELRRQLREGGQLRAGDALSDGRYLLVKTIGRGGFATVWEAYDCESDRRVAIKVLHSNISGDPLRRERFFRGALVMMSLMHPAVVHVLDPKGEEGGFCYFVMEFVPGGNLRDAVLQSRVDYQHRVALILQIGEALTMAHANHLVHRDVKPQNILLDAEGNAKLTDFDLVAARDTSGGTRTGALGTFVYAAPECLEKPQDATFCADVFGLGMTAIFCLSGEDLRPATFRNPALTIARLDCSIDLQKVLEQAVKWEPELRYADAAAMLMALRAAVNAPSQTALMDDRRSTDRESLGREQTDFGTPAELDKTSSDVHDGSSNAAVMSRDDRLLAGRYQLVRLLGRGTSCDVYEVIDLLNGSIVALKRFREASNESLLRIKSEFRTLAGIHAPGLVRFFELVVSQDATFFTMELVDGVPLTEYARTATTDALRTALGQVADAVSELHARDYLHRDLKPANILVTRNGDARVLDFGLADVVGIVGTPAYMAPELFEGRLPSPASDWYSFGAVIYEALAGRIPGAGSDIAEIIVRKQQRRFPTVRELQPEASSELSELAWQLLDPDPEKRPERRAIAAGLLRQESSLLRASQRSPARQ